MLLRLLGPQGVAGLAASLCLAVLLVLQKGETRHWRAQSAQYEQRLGAEQAAHAQTVANYRAAADRARAADVANSARVAAEQARINERTSDEYEKRLAAARAAAGRLRTATAAADRGVAGNAPMPGLSTATGQFAEAAGQDRLSDRLTATEQAIQLDELIVWVRRQAAVDPNGEPPGR